MKSRVPDGKKRYHQSDIKEDTMKTEGEMIGNALRVRIEGDGNYRKNISTVSGAVLRKRITSLISKCTSAQLI